MPNKRELFSLIVESQFNPVLPSGHPFIGVQSYYYWSSTTRAASTGSAWFVDMRYGIVDTNFKTRANRVWPVRAGQ